MASQANDLPVGQVINLPGHFDEPVRLDEARPLGRGYEYRVRSPNGSLEEAGTDGLPLDSRSIAARSLFAAVLRKKGVVALPLLQQEAQRLAESGTYPYSALASGVNQLGRMDAGLAETVFADSLAAYQQSSPTLAGNADFVNMLRLNRGPAAHADVQQAVTTVVNNLLAHPADSDQEKLPQPIQYQGATVDNPTDFLLLQLMPVARELQPDLLDHIAQSRPALGKAANAVSAMPRESWFPGQLGNSAAAATNPERAALNRIQGAAASDPKQALAMANTQQDPLARSQALAAVASGMASKDPQQASQVLDDAQKAAEKIDDQRKELQALIAMAIASNRMNNQVVLRDSLARGFVLGDELLRQQQNEHPEQPPSDQGLSALVRAGVRPQLELTVAGIETLQNPQVKAQLLVIAAQSMPRRRAAPKSPAPAAVAEKPAAPAPLHPQ